MPMNEQDEILRRYGRTFAKHATSEDQLAALIDDMPEKRLKELSSVAYKHFAQGFMK